MLLESCIMLSMHLMGLEKGAYYTRRSNNVPSASENTKKAGNINHAQMLYRGTSVGPKEVNPYKTGKLAPYGVGAQRRDNVATHRRASGDQEAAFNIV